MPEAEKFGEKASEEQKMRLVRSWTRRIEQLKDELAEAQDSDKASQALERQLNEAQRELARWIEGVALETAEITASDKAARTKALIARVQHVQDQFERMRAALSEQSPLAPEIEGFQAALLNLKASMEA